MGNIFKQIYLHATRFLRLSLVYKVVPVLCGGCKCIHGFLEEEEGGGGGGGEGVIFCRTA